MRKFGNDKFLKCPINLFEEEMRKIDKDRFRNCLRIFSKRRGGNLAKTSFEIVLECFRRGDEKYWQRQVLKLSWNVLEEKMRKFGKDKFWNCQRKFSEKRWGNLATTFLKLSWNIFEEELRKVGNDKFWNCLEMFSKRKWGILAKTSFKIVSKRRWKNLATTSFEIVLEHFRRGNEDIWQR